MLADHKPLVVLVVEDEWLVRFDLSHALEAQGWIVWQASTAEKALAIFHGTAVDIVITDISLGGPMDGWDLAEKFRADTPALPIIYASANGDDRNRRVGGSMFVNKPYDSGDVAKLCGRLIGS